MRVDPTTLLATLDAAVQARRAPTVLKMAHEALLEHMRGTGEAPDWERYPIGRDYFVQRSRLGIRSDSGVYRGEKIMTKFQKVLKELKACDGVRRAVDNYQGDFDRVWANSYLATKQNVNWLYVQLLYRVYDRHDTPTIRPCLSLLCDCNKRFEIVSFLAAQSWEFHRICLKAAIEAYELRKP